MRVRCYIGGTFDDGPASDLFAIYAINNGDNGDNQNITFYHGINLVQTCASMSTG
jgi:hypothetical protein